MKIPSLGQIWQKISETFKRFPLAFMASLIGTGIAVYAIDNRMNEEWIARIIFTASWSVFFFTALALACEVVKKKNRGILMGIGVILMVLYFLSLPESMNLSGERIFMRHVFLCLASFIAIVWSPFWEEKIKNEVMWEWVRQIIMNVVQTVFFGIVIFAGISAAIFAVNSLFGLDIDVEIYLKLWTCVVGAFGPIYFLGNLAENPRKLKIPKPIPAFMKILTKYILTPLAVGYFLILYTYTFKVLITWEWPKNLLGWLVIGFSVVAVLTYFLWTPFWKEKIAKYRRLFWWGLLPQIAMLFIAIGWRIQAYSWTENRYFVVILGLWLLGISIYFLINKKATFKSIFIALTAIILISQIGPMSGYSVGERAQKGRLVELLENSQILQNGKIIPAKIELEKSVRYEISDTIDYLVRHHGKESVVEIFPEIMAKLETDKKVYRYSLAQDITNELGFDFVSKWEMRESGAIRDVPTNFSVKWNAPRNISGYDWFIPSVNRFPREDNINTLGERNIQIKANPSKNFIEIWEDEKMLEKIDFTDFFTGLLADKELNKLRNNSLSPEELSYKYDGENLKSKIFFQSITANKDKVKYFDIQLYLSFK